MAHDSLLQLHVRVRELSSAPENLLDLVPVGEGVTAWLGTDLSAIGWGNAAHLEFAGAHAMRDAARAWDFLAANALVETDYEGDPPPVEWPISLTSFGFAAQSTGYLIVPEFSVVTAGEQIWAVTVASGTRPPNPLEVLIEDAPRVARPSGLWTEPGRMTQTRWKEAVRRLAMMLQSGAASKVVLTRDIVVSASQPIDERFLLRELKERYPSTWVYAVEGLIGATPEMLASFRGGRFKSRVLAGTSEPGEGESLLSSAKNRTEHHLAVESVARALAPLAEVMTVPAEPSLLDLPNPPGHRRRSRHSGRQRPRHCRSPASNRGCMRQANFSTARRSWFQTPVT